MVSLKFRSLPEMYGIVSGSVSLILVMPASVKVDESDCNVMLARVSQLMTAQDGANGQSVCRARNFNVVRDC